MKFSGLSFDAIPPISVPFRFFIAAPFFAIAVGFLLFFSDPFELTNRWSHLSIVITHALTLGFMLMIMMGALFQIMPVILSVKIPQTEKLSQFVFLFFAGGVASLMLGLLLNHPVLLSIAVLSLLLSLSSFIFGLARCLPNMSINPSSITIRLAIIGLVVTLIFGFLFIIARLSPGFFASFRLWTNIHLMWGLIGWVFLLIMGVSFKIIPMFYVTKDYPAWITQYLAKLIFSQLILISFLQTQPALEFYLLITLCLTTCLHPAFSLSLIAKRKRKSLDITIWFWQFSMANFLVAAAIYISLLFLPFEYQQFLEMLLGVVFLVGFVLCLMIGMLLKIVPFLVWLNIQQAWIKHPSTKMPLSNMQQVISISKAKRQFSLFVLLYVSIGLWLLFPQSAWALKLLAMTVIINFTHLLVVLLQAKQLYQQLAKTLS